MTVSSCRLRNALCMTMILDSEKLNPHNQNSVLTMPWIAWGGPGLPSRTSPLATGLMRPTLTADCENCGLMWLKHRSRLPARTAPSAGFVRPDLSCPCTRYYAPIHNRPRCRWRPPSKVNSTMLSHTELYSPRNGNISRLIIELTCTKEFCTCIWKSLFIY